MAATARDPSWLLLVVRPSVTHCEFGKSEIVRKRER